MTQKPLSLAAAVVLVSAGQACAWGDIGHEVTGLIAYRHLTKAAKAKVDALLASDTDTLTAPDFASRTTWADKYRNSHRETAPWHFVDIEVDNPDLSAACFGFPAIPAGQPVSQGPANDCVVDKISEFAAKLHNPATPAAERLLALKFVMHFVGDLHQPLHASDHSDKGGNCVGLSPSPDGEVKNLHAYWDVSAVKANGSTAQAIADTLERRISAKMVRTWSQGDPRAWAQETFAVSRRDAYHLASRPTCAAPGAVSLTPAYQNDAKDDAARQLEIAGVRLAFVLNTALGA